MILTVSLITIGVNTIITTLIFTYLAGLFLEWIETENQYDKMVIKNIKYIYDHLGIKYRTKYKGVDYENTKNNKKRITENTCL